MTPEGRTERFDEIFAEHIDAVLGYALARVDPETAKDAVADTFLVAWRRLSDVPDAPRAWLLGVTRRTLAGHRRSRARQFRLVERLGVNDSFPDRSESPHDDAVERAVVTAALARLRPADRELLCLVAWDGLSHDEACEALGCSRPTFAVRLHRARQRLAEALVVEDGRRPAPEADPRPEREVTHDEA